MVDEKPRKKEKKSHPKDDDDEPFDLDKDFYRQLNEQMRRMFESMGMGNIFPTGTDFSEPLARMMHDFMKKMNIRPSDLNNMTPDQMRDVFSRAGKMGSPFVFGVNMNIGPDGKPNIGSFGNVKQSSEGGESEVKPERDPLVDIYEEDGHYVVVVEVPGVKKEDIELRASTNEIEISAEAPEDAEINRKYHKVIPLPGEINPEVAKARYQNGILEVKLDKVGEKSGKTKIKID